MKHNQIPFLTRFAGCAGLILLLSAAVAQAQQALPYYEPFPSSDTVGEELGQTGTAATWNTGNSISSSCARVENYAALDYPGLFNIDATNQSYGLMSYTKDTSSTKDRAVLLTIPASTTVYASCLLNILQLTNTSTWQFFGLSTTATVVSSVANGATVFFNPAGQLQIAKNSGTPATNTTYSLTESNTYLVVIRYKVNPGAPDEMDLWLNPTSLGNDNQIPPPTISTTNNANISAFGSVAYYQVAKPPQFYLDEIRVATDWAGVTPTDTPASNTYSVTGGGSGCAGDGFAVGLTGSDSGVTYLLYTNGVPNGVSATGTGSALSFGLQTNTGLYTVLATNSTTGFANWMNTNATLSLLALPNIASQPAPVVVATNGLCAFTVTSLGSGLNYQWYRNGTALTDGGHISGSLTPTLIVSPATAADAASAAAGYYVIVANRCGSGVVSITNALTLDAAASLLWYGDGASNFWDIATSTNWNYSNTLGVNTAVFNYGDNVTFDDSSPIPTVNLTNADLSPTSITINGTQNYTFNGGTLVGGGSLLMNNSGTLTLNSQNNLTGGLVISNGSVAFASPACLGSGPITLAGGTLTAPGSGLVTIPNSIIITTNEDAASSVIDVNSPGGQPTVLTAPLIGLAGTLTVENVTSKNAATAHLELTATNFTFGLSVDLNVGTGTGTGMQLVGDNTSGTQTWNGLFTDAGGIWRDASGGTTLMNNTNSYSGGSTLTSGSLGVGADSIIDSGTLVAGPLGTGTLYIDTGNNNMQLFASGGAHMIANPVAYTTNLLGPPLIISGSYNLTLAGGYDLTGALTGTNRTIEVDNPALIISGVITDDGNILGLAKTGSGFLYLDATNEFTGELICSNGILAGTGNVAGPVAVLGSGALGAGDAGSIPGTFGISNNLTLGANLWIRVNKSQAQSNDVILVTGTLANSGTGTVIVTNVGPTLHVGDTFTLFNQPVSGGAALAVTGGGMTWNNHLATDGGITATGVVITSPPVLLAPTIISGSLVFGVSNAVSGSTYYVLSTTNLTLPVASWTPVSTNTYQSGTFSITNAVSPSVPQKFFILSPNP